MSSPITAQEKGPLLDHCGIVALYSSKNSSLFLTGLAGLSKLQTRGYDGAGFFSRTDSNRFYQYKNEGDVRHVFTPAVVKKYKNRKAHVWLFQTRYGTQGATHIKNVQPIVMKSTWGDTFSVVHNGQFSMDPQSAQVVLSDTVQFAQQLAMSPKMSWTDKILDVESRKNGAWSVAVSTNEALYLLRDSYGVRPLSIGMKRDEDTHQDVWAVASETVALEAMGIKDYWEILPGSIIRIDENGQEFLKKPTLNSPRYACSFENIYVKDGDSRQHVPRQKKDDLQKSQTVDDFRIRCGQLLAKEWPVKGNVDLAVGVPGTGIAGGRSYAQALGIPYLQVIHDRIPQDDTRTFMTPNITDIPQKVLEHFHFTRNYIEGMNIVMVDDSLVRGNITKYVIQILKTPISQGGYGVKDVHVRILCPPIVRGCYLGINTRKETELIAAKYISPREERNPVAVKKMVEGVRKEIGAKSLGFLSPESLQEAAGIRSGFCMGCMLGHFPPVDRFGKRIQDLSRNNNLVPNAPL